MTQAQLAEALDVTFQTVSSWERDGFLHDVERLGRLAGVLQTSIGRLTGEEVVLDWSYRKRLFDENHM